MSSGGQRVLFFAPTPVGGIAEHVHYQARELVRRGFAVTVLCQPGFREGTDATYRQERRLIAIGGRSLVARLTRVLASIANWYLLALRIARSRPRFIVLEANTEYHAPFWFWPHRLLRALGAIYLANFHDPVRARRWGPAWFHRLTLHLAYSPLSGGLIHGPVSPNGQIPSRLIMREAPFGAFEDLSEQPESFDLRERLGMPRDAFVLLAFGHLADRKNLDLVMAAVAEFDTVHLVVAGAQSGGGNRPVAFYRALADRLGLVERVHFIDGFIPEQDISSYFLASDAVALTYEREFVSQSGVLQIAALFDRPVLASGGEGPLRQTVDRFGLGVTVVPDSAVAIADGLRRLLARETCRTEGFARYRATTSWAANVDRLLEVVAAARARRRT